MTANIKAAVALMPWIERSLDDRVGRTLKPPIFLSEKEARAFLAALRDMEPVASDPPRAIIAPCDPTPEMISAGHQQIDWCRDKEKTDTPYDESQVTRDKYGNQLGTYCGQDLKDAWIAMLAARPK